MKDKQDATSSNKPKRDEKGRLLPGGTANPNGRPVESKEKKLEKKAKREFIAEYKQELREALPKISPVLIDKAVEGDMTAIKEVNDRVMGKAPQSTEVRLEIDRIEGFNYIVPEE